MYFIICSDSEIIFSCYTCIYITQLNKCMARDQISSGSNTSVAIPDTLQRFAACRAGYTSQTSLTPILLDFQYRMTCRSVSAALGSYNCCPIQYMRYTMWQIDLSLYQLLRPCTPVYGQLQLLLTVHVGIAGESASREVIMQAGNILMKYLMRG